MASYFIGTMLHLMDKTSSPTPFFFHCHYGTVPCQSVPVHEQPPLTANKGFYYIHTIIIFYLHNIFFFIKSLHHIENNASFVRCAVILLPLITHLNLTEAKGEYYI